MKPQRNYLDLASLYIVLCLCLLSKCQASAFAKQANHKKIAMEFLKNNPMLKWQCLISESNAGSHNKAHSKGDDKVSNIYIRNVFISNSNDLEEMHNNIKRHLISHLDIKYYYQLNVRAGFGTDFKPKLYASKIKSPALNTEKRIEGFTKPALEYVLLTKRDTISYSNLWCDINHGKSPYITIRLSDLPKGERFYLYMHFLYTNAQGDDTYIPTLPNRLVIDVP